LALDNFLAPAISGITAFLLIVWMLKSPRAKLILDHPNPRSLHTTPMPRTGGIAVMVGIFVATATLLPRWDWSLVLAVILALVFFLDDRHGLPIALRFCAQLFLATAFVAMTLPGLSALSQIALISAIVWVTNLYNFMDGSDGLAGGMSLIGFGAYALAAWLQGETFFASLNASVAAAAAAFLIFNFYPAKIFLGDTGSIPLGFLAATLGLSGWQHALWPLWFPPLVFSPFIIDASVTLARRLIRVEKVWQAHHSHYYQRLVRMGWGHGGTALMEYAVMLAVAASAIWALGLANEAQWSMLLIWAVLYAAALALIDYRWSKH
jgi:UDP-N-acetylmuramyl pentapeptide phosphotransferase/UDP-N-acetylglucosamine-1-phosphate transferase